MANTEKEEAKEKKIKKKNDLFQLKQYSFSSTYHNERARISVRFK